MLPVCRVELKLAREETAQVSMNRSITHYCGAARRKVLSICIRPDSKIHGQSELRAIGRWDTALDLHRTAKNMRSYGTGRRIALSTYMSLC